jgi:hypothetical protein
MMLRAVKLIVQAALLVQVLHVTGPVSGLEVSENFKNTQLTEKDAPGTVHAEDLPDTNDKQLQQEEERGFFDWITGGDDDTPAPTTAPVAQTTAPAAETTASAAGTTAPTTATAPAAGSSADLATTTPIPGAATRTPTSQLMSKFGSMDAEFGVSKDASGSAAAGSAAGAGSSATTATTAPKTKKPAATTKKPATTTKKPATAAAASGGSADASGSSLADLLGSAAGSGSSLDDLLESSTASGSAGSDDISSLLAGMSSGAGGSGSSALSFEDFMKSLGSSFGSGSSMIDLFGDPTQPQNNTVNEDDILLGELYGGKEHGDAFSDIKNVKFQQMILNITLRGNERVDQVGLLVMTQEAVGNLVHGGTGGNEKFVELEMGDAITSVEVNWDKNKGKTCIFYMDIKTTSGKSLSAGTPTTNVGVMKAPEGYQLIGFHGRASSSGIFCIGAIWGKTTATDLAVTDIMALPSGASPDVYNYQTTIRNWVGPLDEAADNACYQKKFDVNSIGVCPSGFDKSDDTCVTQCPLNYPVECVMECIPQNADCAQEIISKISSVVAVALNAATLGVFGALIASYKAANFALTCAINVVNAVKSLIYYLRYKQTTIPTTDNEKLMDKAFQLQIVILDLPLAICSCLGIKIPAKLQFSATILAVVSAIVMMAVMIGDAIFSSSDNVMLMLRESGALNGTELNGDTMELDDFLNSKNGTCGYEMKTLTNRVMGKVYEIRNNTPNAAANDVRVEVSKSTIITEDIPIVTNHCMGQIYTNKTSASAYDTRNLLRKTLGVIVDQIIEDGTTDMGKNVVKKEKALEYSNMGLFILSVFDPTGIAWMASEFVQPICGPTEYLGEIDDGTLYDALGLNTIDQAFLGSYGVWKKKGDGSINVFFESIDAEDVSVVIHSGGEKIEEIKVASGTNVTWTSTVTELGDKTLYLDRWRPGLLGLPGSGGGSLLLWVPHSAEGGQLTLHARLNVS